MGDSRAGEIWEQFTKGWGEVEKYVREVADRHGFSGKEDGLAIALMHSELSEALEAYRDGNPPSEKLPGRTQLEEELADCVIRIMDFAGERDMNIPEAIIEKALHNAQRPYRHGRKVI